MANWSFSAFGSRRRSTWQDTLLPEEYAPIAATTRRGFTGHEHLDNLSLVHMNGRVYDPKLGRFMSADPVYVGNLARPQSLNPYSYVMNNPLTFTDPSGFNQELCGSDPNCLSVVANPGGYDIVLPSAGHFVWGGGGSGGASSGTGGSRPSGTSDPESQRADRSQSGPTYKPAPQEQVLDEVVVNGKKPFNWTNFANDWWPGYGIGSCIYASFADGGCNASGWIWAGIGGLPIPEGKILQTGGRAVSKATAKALNSVFGRSVERRDWGRALESLKRDLDLPNDHHGRIGSNGDYLDDVGNVLGNIGDYLP